MKNTSAIARFRDDRDRMTLEEFGKLFEPPVDKSTVLRWERGLLNPKRAIEIERVTGISRRELLPDLFGISTEAAE